MGYQATKRRIFQLGLDHKTIVLSDSKGRLSFLLKDFKDVTFQITTKGKLGVFYPKGTPYSFFLKKVKPLLVKADGTPVEITGVIKKPFEPKDEIMLSFGPREGEIVWQNGQGLLSIVATLSGNRTHTFHNVHGKFWTNKEIYVSSSNLRPVDYGIPALYFGFKIPVLHKKSAIMLSTLTLKVPRGKGKYVLNGELIAEELENWTFFGYALKVANDKFEIACSCIH